MLTSELRIRNTRALRICIEEDWKCFILSHQNKLLQKKINCQVPVIIHRLRRCYGFANGIIR